MAFYLRLALWASLVFWSASELVIDVQPNVILPEITPQLVINCSITNNQVQQIEVIKCLTLSRYNETIKEFDDLFVLNSSTLDLKQLQQFQFSQISFGNLYITLTLNNPSQFDAKVYRCNATGDNAEGTNISLFAKKTVEYETSSTAFIEEIRRLKQDKNNCQSSLRSQKSRLQFDGSSEIIRELIEPLTLNCSFKFSNNDNQETSTLQALFILHETKGVIAYINKGQPVVTTMKEVKSKNVKGEIYPNKLKDSYLQVTWTKLKLSYSGKYVCEAHVQFLEGRSEKFNEMLTITVQSPTFNDLVNVIQKLITQVEEDKESIQVNKRNIENFKTSIRKEIQLNKENISSITEDLDIKTQNMEIMRVGLERNFTSLTEIVNANAQNIKNMRFTMNTNITSIKEDMDTTSQNIMSIIVDTNNTITMLKKDIGTNAGNITILREDIDGNITKLKEDLGTNKQLQINLQENLRMEVANISTDLTELRNQMDEVKKNIFLTSCLDVQSFEARAIVMLSSGLKVMCDTKTDGGGWIIFQRRINGKVDFYRGWKEYRDGFGDYNIGEFYLGNENIFKLTSTGQIDLRIDLEFQNKTYFAQYEDFKVLSETEKYKLHIGKYSGNAGDSLRRQNNMFFSTLDSENDIYNTGNCAQRYLGAWWYKDCHDSNLNGQWGSKSYAEGMNWYGLTKFDYSVTFSEMKIRERD
ncbi:BgMFREP17.2 [Biomphalaria glabrata]|nr:angiopoietin-4-like [Biomphalaria glabrata]